MDVGIGDYPSLPVSGVPVDLKLKQNEEGVPEIYEKSTIATGSTSGSLNSDNANGSNSDLSYHNNNDDDELIDEDDDCMYDDEDDDYMYDDDDADYDSMQAQFDNVDLPPGVEASVSWMKEEPVATTNNPASTSTASMSYNLPQPKWMSSLKVYDPTCSKTEAATTSSSTASAEPSSKAIEEDGKEDEVMEKFQLFKQFDIVEDFSDHTFVNNDFSGQKPAMSWSKAISDDWKSLEHNLPDTIYVRIYEARMDLLRAIIVGPAGTPYHDGLFVFDVVFPPTYPIVPPKVHYHSGGLRLNPNLYACGKVCLSLLGTWSGEKTELWMPGKSTMLQVLVSIQALILNTKPFFNEPGYPKTYVGADGEKRSNKYNEDVFIMSLKTMIYTLRKPPKNFEDLVVGHFRVRAHAILSACKAYVEGAEIGSDVSEAVKKPGAAGFHCQEFRQVLAKMLNGLVNNFTRYGAKDCEKYRVPC